MFMNFNGNYRVFIRLLLLAASIFYLLLSCSYAAPCYGTKLPRKGEFFGGVQTHTIFKRHLEGEYGKVRAAQYFFQLSYGVYNWLSVDLKAGAGNIKQHPLGSDEADYPSSFAGGYGFRIKCYDKEKINMVFGFQHISVHPKSIHLEEIKNKAILDDWQVSLLASYDFSKITPYLGVKWSRVDYIHWLREDRKRRMSDSTKSFGLVCGFDLPLAEDIWLNSEGQFFDGEAFSFSFNFKF